MIFDELWVEIEKLHILPDAAIAQMPQILSKETACWKSPEKVCRIIIEVIDQVNNGSIETLDVLIRKKL